MSTKQLALELIRRMSDKVSAEEIITAVAAGLKTQTDLEYDTSDITDDEWAAFVAQGLEAELNDPREDVYTFDDGKPIHDAG
jgi:hypothetical protein